MGRSHKGWGHYQDRYRKTAKGWLIVASSYKWIHVERG
jgi:hypothetical protein